MKSSVWVLAAVIILLGAAGCKKSRPQSATQDRYGVGIDWPKLDTEFQNNGDPNVQAAVASIKRSILYHQFSKAIADLEKLSGHPALSESQKKS